MQGIGSIVDGERVALAIQRELALGNPVAVAADDGAEVRIVLQVAVERVEAERHVRRRT